MGIAWTASALSNLENTSAVVTLCISHSRLAKGYSSLIMALYRRWSLFADLNLSDPSFSRGPRLARVMVEGLITSAFTRALVCLCKAFSRIGLKGRNFDLMGFGQGIRSMVYLINFVSTKSESDIEPTSKFCRISTISFLILTSP